MSTTPPSAAAPRAYCGRFAPTPSGPLHAGSLLTALGSWLQARHRGGRWLLRIDDLDVERCRPQYADAILRQLEAHGLYWDATPLRQAQMLPRYAELIERLRQRGVLYGCDCTRARAAKDQRQGRYGPVYGGRCRTRGLPTVRGALRYATVPGRLTIVDPGLGVLTGDAAADVGDFVVRRADGVPGYHLACAADEQALGISEVVRGVDLLGAAFCQSQLLTALGLPQPAYRHLPLLMGADGLKLSKQNHAAPLDDAQAGANIYTSLLHLRQAPPPQLRGAAPEALLDWAVSHWNPAAFTGLLEVHPGASVVP